jgi:hypothetical protein
MASNGRFLYVHTGTGIFKIGTGYGGSRRGKVDCHLKHSSDDATDIPWIGCVGGFLLVRSKADTPGVFMALRDDTLEVHGAIVQEESDSRVGELPYSLFTHGTDTLGVLEDTANGWRLRMLAFDARPGVNRLKTARTLLMTPSAQRVAACGAGSWQSRRDRKKVSGSLQDGCVAFSQETPSHFPMLIQIPD